MPGEIRLVRLGKKGKQEQGHLNAPILSTTHPINFSALYNKLAYEKVNHFEDNLLQHFKRTQSNIAVVEKKAKEWAPPTIVVIPPQVCGGGASYNEIIKHLRGKNSELEIYAINDSNDNDYTDRSTSRVAEDYLNVLLEADEFGSC